MLRHTLADVERGVWQPQVVEAPDETPIPTFHEFAEEWWTRHVDEYAPKTVEDYSWRLQVHLLKFFGELPLDRIKIATVEDYIAFKLQEDDPLGPRAINMTVTLLAAILESAVDRELISRNPARGRKLKERAPQRSQLDAADQISALLDAAGDLDRDAQDQAKHIERRAMIATLTFAGLRIGELCALRWRDVDLAGGWLHVGEAKTDAGRRKVKIRGVLRDELLAVRQGHQDALQSAPVFATSRGAAPKPDNLRNRVLKPAVKHASARLEADNRPPLPERITPHSLRRTFASLLYALGETPPIVMQEMGHTDPGLALKVYAQSMRRGEDEKAALRALVEGEVLANSGQRADSGQIARSDAEAA
jgi:integrase